MSEIAPPCPFQVGDRIHEMIAFGGYARFGMANTGEIVEESRWDNLALDWSKPSATVTAITERGFEYEYDTPFAIGRAQWGQMCTGGECYPEGYQFWRKLT